MGLNRRDLKMIAVGGALVSSAAFAALAANSLLASQAKSARYIKLHDVSATPAWPNSKFFAEYKLSPQYLAEPLRKRDGGVGNNYAAQIARECGLSVFDAEFSTDEAAWVMIPVDANSDKSLACVLERASREVMPLSLVSRPVKN